jgi:membrane associated rhomboid family serine protease
MLLPLTSDAGLKFWPIVTVGLIILHISIYCIQMAIPNKEVEIATGMSFEDGAPIVFIQEVPGWYGLMRSHGDGLHPLQWLTAMMMHASWMHVIGNMIFLWALAIWSKE